MKNVKLLLLASLVVSASAQSSSVAKEVETIYPELVVHDEAGKVESVRYSMLTSMLLNELQKQAKELKMQIAENRNQAERIDRLTAQVDQQQTAFEQRLEAMERTVAAKAPDSSPQAALNR